MRTPKTILLVVVLLAAATAAHAQGGQDRSVTVTPLKLSAGSASVEGSLRNGVAIPLGWAERSSVACFPGTRFEMFDGSHVFYRVEMPARTRLTITLVPKDGAAINLYALRLGSGSKLVPPNISSATSCEAKYPIYANKPGGGTVRNADDGKRKIEFISVGSPYTILIGAAGAKGLTEGTFELSVEVAAR